MNEVVKKWVRGGTAVLALLALVTGPSTSAQEESTTMNRRIEPTISVAGTGKISAAPDVADIQLGVVTQAATAREALSKNNESMSALVSILKERGVAEKDIQTSQVNVQPQYSQPRPPRPGAESAQEFVPRIVSYQVTNMVRVTSRDLTKLGTILDAVVSAGANQIHGISFRIDEPDKLLDQARKQAMADAKHRAELMAGEAGVVVGPPIAIRESEAVPIAQPMYMGRMAMEAAAPAAPIAAGEQELSVRVDVTYRLVLPKTGGD